MPDSQFDNGLNSPETERLALLAEECGKTGRRIGEILREGYPSRNAGSTEGRTRREDLEYAIGELIWSIELMAHCGDISMLRARADGGRHARKTRRLHHQDGQGLS